MPSDRMARRARTVAAHPSSALGIAATVLWTMSWTMSWTTLSASCAFEREREPHPTGESRIHEDGILAPSSSGFHGALLREVGYDFALCARCHGDDFDGGAAESSCITCHAEGPTACETCHATLLTSPMSAAHARHLPGGVLRFDACADCHVVPLDWRDAGHVFNADGTLDAPPAEVVITGLGALGSDGTEGREARFDRESGSCQSVYCHGGTFDDSAATNVAPRWDAVGTGQTRCGTCHGTPPSDHASGACRTCHGEATTDDAGNLLDDTHHIDGVIDLGRDGSDPDGCDGCHGTAASAAPPVDLLGRTSTALTSVGAHAVHVTGAHRLAAPIACAECHVVPATRDDVGHIDSALPAEVTFGALARAGGATPAWLPGATRCAGVYCHGGGPVFASDAATGRVPTPGWTALGVGMASCGACHGVPPVDAAHTPAMTLRDCTTCHASVDAYGNVLFVGERSAHIDGTVDVR